jgi:hypothetical protein
VREYMANRQRLKATRSPTAYTPARIHAADDTQRIGVVVVGRAGGEGGRVGTDGQIPVNLCERCALQNDPIATSDNVNGDDGDHTHHHCSGGGRR